AGDVDIAGQIDGDAVGLIVEAAAEVSGVGPAAAPKRRQLRDEGIGAARVGAVKRTESRETAACLADDGDFAVESDGDAASFVAACAADVGGVHERAAGGAELGGEGIAPAAAGGLGGPAGRVRAAARDARDESVAGPIHRDGVTAVFVEAAEIGRVGEAGAGRVDLGDEGVGGAAGEARVVGVDRGKGGRIGGHAECRRVGAAG